jgi:hypothetical protein
VTTPHPPDLDHPPPAAAQILKRSWPILAAAAAIAVLALIPAMLTRLDHSIPIADRDLTPSCASLTTAVQPAPPLPAGLPAFDGQLVYQTGRLGRTQFTFTAVPNPDLDAVLNELTRELRAAGYTITLTQPAPPASNPPRGYDQVSRKATLTVTGPAGNGTITVSGRCTTQSDIDYTLTPP